MESLPHGAEGGVAQRGVLAPRVHLAEVDVPEPANELPEDRVRLAHRRVDLAGVAELWVVR